MTRLELVRASAAFGLLHEAHDLLRALLDESDVPETLIALPVHFDADVELCGQLLKDLAEGRLTLNPIRRRDDTITLGMLNRL